MKVKFTIEIEADIPGEFQNDTLAMKLLQDEIDELLSIGCEYEKDDQPTVMFISSKMRKYFVTAGRI